MLARPGQGDLECITPIFWSSFHYIFVFNLSLGLDVETSRTLIYCVSFGSKRRNA